MSAESAVAPRFERRLYLPLVLGSVLNPLSSSMLAVSLAPIGLYFGVGPAETAWLVSGRYLATSVGQPVVGRLVDTFGARRVFLAATSLAVGVPQGLVNLANQNALYTAAPSERLASAAGLLRTFRYVGAIVSAASHGALLGEGTATSGIHDIAALLVGLAVLFAALTLFDRGLRRGPTG